MLKLSLLVFVFQLIRLSLAQTTYATHSTTRPATDDQMSAKLPLITGHNFRGFRLGDFPLCEANFRALVGTCDPKLDAGKIGVDFDKAISMPKIDIKVCCMLWDSFTCTQEIIKDVSCKEIKSTLVTDFGELNKIYRQKCIPERNGCKNTGEPIVEKVATVTPPENNNGQLVAKVPLVTEENFHGFNLKAYPLCEANFKAHVGSCDPRLSAAKTGLDFYKAMDQPDVDISACCMLWDSYNCNIKLLKETSCKEVKSTLVSDFDELNKIYRKKCVPERNGCKVSNAGVREKAQLPFVLVALVSAILLQLF